MRSRTSIFWPSGQLVRARFGLFALQASGIARLKINQNWEILMSYFRYCFFDIKKYIVLELD